MPKRMIEVDESVVLPEGVPVERLRVKAVLADDVVVMEGGACDSAVGNWAAGPHVVVLPPSPEERIREAVERLGENAQVGSVCSGLCSDIRVALADLKPQVPASVRHDLDAARALADEIAGASYSPRWCKTSGIMIMDHIDAVLSEISESS